MCQAHFLFATGELKLLARLRKERIVKYIYRFVNGETRTIEVNEAQYRMLTDEDRLE